MIFQTKKIIKMIKITEKMLKMTKYRVFKGRLLTDITQKVK